ncbi:hypothetical protein SEVIR_5G192600v4 [Setaria viridis]|uniref:Uncharacterized protein n=1 Tax=Setaria viridis TaxID=4556 RepID=A0A4V6D6N7_SETVI|nr:hypothetical protein SEVIR_5G192600v2 [Setaria viridis]
MTRLTSLPSPFSVSSPSWRLPWLRSPCCSCSATAAARATQGWRSLVSQPRSRHRWRLCRHHHDASAADWPTTTTTARGTTRAQAHHLAAPWVRERTLLRPSRRR